MNFNKDNFNYLNDNLTEKMFVVSDNYSTKDIISSASSLALKNYKPTYDATVIKRLYENGYHLLGKCKTNPFGIPTQDFFDEVGSVVQNNNIIGISSDTFGNTARLASKYRVFAYKPTYGLISRYGLFQVASSFDTVNIVANNITQLKETTDMLKGYDNYDMTIHTDKLDLIENLEIVVIKEIVEDSNNFKSILKLLEENFQIKEISLNESVLSKVDVIHQTISSVESLSSFGSYTSLLISPRGEGNNFKDIMTNYRSENFNDEVKTSIVLGSVILDQENYDKYYIKALKNRRQVVNNFKEILKTNLILLPSYDDLNKYKEVYKIANLGGFPYLSYEDKFSILGDLKTDYSIFNLAKLLGDKNEI